MKKLLIGTLALTLAACMAAPGVEKSETANSENTVMVSDYGLGYGMYRFVDSDAGVVCWFYTGTYKGGMDCMPISDTLLDK